MNVEYREIRSSSSPDDDRPFYDLSVTDGGVVVDKDGDGGTGVDLSGESIAVDTSGDSVVAVSSDGDLITYPVGEKRILRAHLGWYHAGSDTLTLLEFVEAGHS